MLGLEAFSPGRLGRSGEHRFRGLGELYEVGGVGTLHLVLLAARLELLQRVLPNGVEHAVAPLLTADEALVHERAERVERRATYGLDRVESEAANKDGKPPKQLLLGLVEQLEAPVDRAAESPLAVRAVARPCGQELEPVLEAREDRAGGEHLHTSRRELDREWQSVEPSADLRGHRHLDLPELQVWLGSTRSLAEQRNRRLLGERPEDELVLA